MLHDMKESRQAGDHQKELMLREQKAIEYGRCEMRLLPLRQLTQLAQPRQSGAETQAQADQKTRRQQTRELTREDKEQITEEVEMWNGVRVK